MAKQLSSKERFPELYTKTHIDRRGAKRTVPMKVLVLGLCRTGTSSIWTALKQLGYHDVYHMISVAENPPDTHLWREAVDAKFYGIGKPYEKAQWDSLLGHCEAVTDFPCVAFGPELIETYPDAKVILTTRPVDKWFFSTNNTINAAMNSFPLYFVSFLDPTFLGPWIAMANRMWVAFFHGSFEKNGKNMFLEHYAEMKRLVPNERLLEYEVGKDGWEPLCEFLGVPVPEGEFPRVNETKAFGDRIEVLMKLKVVRALKTAAPWISALGVVGVGVVGFKRGWF